MAHPAQQEFCCEVKRLFPEFFANTRVLEIGSRNINGSGRDLFEDCGFTTANAPGVAARMETIRVASTVIVGDTNSRLGNLL